MNININQDVLIKDFMTSDFFQLPSPLNIGLAKHLDQNGVELTEEEFNRILMLIREQL